MIVTFSVPELKGGTIRIPTELALGRPTGPFLVRTAERHNLGRFLIIALGVLLHLRGGLIGTLSGTQLGQLAEMTWGPGDYFRLLLGGPLGTILGPIGTLRTGLLDLLLGLGNH